MKHFIYYLFGLSLLLLSFNSFAQESYNNSCTSPQNVPVYSGGSYYSVTLHASLTSSDNDYFRFTWQGTTYIARVRGYAGSTGHYDIQFNLSPTNIVIETLSYNGSTTDTYLYLYSSSCSYITANNNGGSGKFSKITRTISSGSGGSCTSDSYESDNTTCTANYGGNYSGNYNGGFQWNNFCVTTGDTDYTRVIIAGQTYYFAVRGSSGRYSIFFNINPSAGTLTIETLPYNGSSVDTRLYLYRRNGSSCNSYKTRIAYNFNGGVGNFSKITYPLSSLLVSNDLEDRNTSILEENETLSVKVVPNPVQTGEFTLEFNKQLDQVSGGLYDLSGKLIKQFTIENAFEHRIDVSDLAAGMYVLRAESNDTTFTEKVIVK